MGPKNARNQYFSTLELVSIEFLSRTSEKHAFRMPVHEFVRLFTNFHTLSLASNSIRLLNHELLVYRTPRGQPTNFETSKQPTPARGGDNQP